MTLSKILAINCCLLLHAPLVVAQQELDLGQPTSDCSEPLGWENVPAGQNLSEFHRFRDYGAQEVLDWYTDAFVDNDERSAALQQTIAMGIECDHEEVFFLLGYLYDMQAGQIEVEAQPLYRADLMNRAFDAYLRAAELGFAPAQSNVCQRLLTGDGTPKNVEEAYAWCYHASRSGMPFAMATLADMFWEGIHTEPNIEMAYILYLTAQSSVTGTAAHFGDKNISARIAKAEELLSPETIERLQRDASSLVRR